MELDSILEIIVKICLKHNIYVIYLFGSRANNLSCSSSDIDIAYRAIGDVDQSLLDEQIESEIVSLKRIDLVNLDKCSDILKGEVLKHGYKIYG